MLAPERFRVPTPNLVSPKTFAPLLLLAMAAAISTAPEALVVSSPKVVLLAKPPLAAFSPLRSAVTSASANSPVPPTLRANVAPVATVIFVFVQLAVWPL